MQNILQSNKYILHIPVGQGEDYSKVAGEEALALELGEVPLVEGLLDLDGGEGLAAQRDPTVETRGQARRGPGAYRLATL